MKKPKLNFFGKWGAMIAFLISITGVLLYYFMPINYNNEYYAYSEIKISDYHYYYNHRYTFHRDGTVDIYIKCNGTLFVEEKTIFLNLNGTIYIYTGGNGTIWNQKDLTTQINEDWIRFNSNKFQLNFPWGNIFIILSAIFAIPLTFRIVNIIKEKKELKLEKSSEKEM